MNCKVLDLGPIIDEQLQLRQQGGNTGSISIEVTCLLIQVRVDKARLAIALANLIDNAIRYNRPNGHIRVNARLDGPAVLIDIEDSGFGIPEEALPRIFERFYRVEKNTGSKGWRCRSRSCYCETRD